MFNLGFLTAIGITVAEEFGKKSEKVVFLCF
jgi:hypothetical protein